MSDVAIKVENLSKKYYLGASANGNLRDTLAHGWNKLWGTATPNAGNKEFWALNDVSFEVKKGEVIGIIGRNGAGKSTLLKILSRITEPTSGRIELDGRVASLLEVGTGFHPELTGRENIFLNGSLLGMTRKEIKKKFDEIVDFSGVEEFIDTPVKKYSSGMYVRLAFAVAAHLEPEILLVDEVLAVGDFEFQKKCLGKMDEVARCGRTVLFVSHNMAAIKKLCRRTILLENQKILKDGNTEITIKTYMELFNNFNNSQFLNKKKMLVFISDIQLCDYDQNPIENINGKERCFLGIKLYADNTNDLQFGFTIFNSENIGIFSTYTSDSIPSIPNGWSKLKIELPVNLLHSGFYRIEGALIDREIIYEKNDNYLSFNCLREERFYIQGQKSKGMLRIPFPWRVSG